MLALIYGNIYGTMFFTDTMPGYKMSENQCGKWLNHGDSAGMAGIIQVNGISLQKKIMSIKQLKS